MKTAIFVSTPAQAHFFRNVITALDEKGNPVNVLARNDGETLLLKQKDLKQEKVIQEKMDVTLFVVRFIEDFPESIKIATEKSFHPGMFR